MSSVLVELGYFTLSYAGVLLFFFVVVNYFLKGFLYHWIRVRPSNGKKILVWAVSTTDTYVTHGFLEDEGFHYKRRDGKINRITKLEQGDTFSAFNVWNVEYDERNNRIINKTNLTRGETDPNDVDRMLAKAVDLPKTAGMKANLVAIMLLVALIGLFVVGVMVFMLFGQIGEILTILNRAGVI
jgi:hypothetical protein